MLYHSLRQNRGLSTTRKAVLSSFPSVECLSLWDIAYLFLTIARNSFHRLDSLLPFALLALLPTASVSVTETGLVTVTATVTTS